MCAVLRSSVGRQGNYGVDTPIVPAVQAFIALLLLQVGYKQLTEEEDGQGVWVMCAGGVLLAFALCYLHASRRGKFRAWNRALSELHLRGDEQVLDVATGRGAVATLVAARVPKGKVLAVDTWAKRGRLTSSKGDTEDTIARKNAVAEKVADRIEFKMADMRAIPVAGNRFDLVTCSLGISSLSPADLRQEAVDEIVRVLKPGGRLAIADINNTKEYQRRLSDLGMEDVKARSMGWEAWYGGPWRPTILVTARKPKLL
jgi:ubiquinone/menaquinone biosynthesis C-methylase UbiE